MILKLQSPPGSNIHFCGCLLIWQCSLLCFKAATQGYLSRTAHRACVLSHFSHVRLFLTPWTVALQAPLSMGFSRQEYWSGLPFTPPGDLLYPGIEPHLLCLLHWQVDSLLRVPPGKPTAQFNCLQTLGLGYLLIVGENWQSRPSSSCCDGWCGWHISCPVGKYQWAVWCTLFCVSFKRNLKPVSEKREACLVLAEGMPPSLLTLENEEFELGFIGSVCWSRLNFVPHCFFFFFNHHSGAEWAASYIP